jgi:hypothetical protein
MVKTKKPTAAVVPKGRIYYNEFERHYHQGNDARKKALMEAWRQGKLQPYMELTGNIIQDIPYERGIRPQAPNQQPIAPINMGRYNDEPLTTCNVIPRQVMTQIEQNPELFRNFTDTAEGRRWLERQHYGTGYLYNFFFIRFFNNDQKRKERRP